MQRSLVATACVCLSIAISMAAQRQKCTIAVDIAMVIDESGSIGTTNFEKIKTFVGDVISRFRVAPFGARFAAVKYSSIPREVFSFTKYTNAAQLHAAVHNMNYRGGTTKTGKALEYVDRNILGKDKDRKDVPKVLLLFSDGQSHDHKKAVRIARGLKAKGVVFRCVGIGRAIPIERLLAKLKELTSKDVYMFKSAKNGSASVEDSLIRDMCQIISACTSQPCKNGGECVHKRKGGYRCKCTPNWEGKNCKLPKWCPKATFSKWGCYKTPGHNPVIMNTSAKILFNRRNAIDWQEGWDNYLENIVCDCAEAAKDAGYRYFCIEFYGECWGYKHFDIKEPHAGAEKCWGKRPNYNTCIHDQTNPICVGTAGHGYVYELN